MCVTNFPNEGNKKRRGVNLTREEVIGRFEAVHGKRYDYSEVVYTKSIEKVKIGCMVHGCFWQRPGDHMRGVNCPDCSGVKMLDTPTIINAFEAVHGNIYDYSEVDYQGNRVKVKIKCKVHGFFAQLYHSHLNGQGCPECYGNKKLNSLKAVDKFITVHGDKYDYSEVNYKGSKAKVQIGCKLHGIFWQTPNRHLTGEGCYECGKIAASEKTTLNQTVVVTRFESIHGDRYDYSKVIYKNSKIKVEIGCKIHGFFWQEPTSHFRGDGCPDCSGRKKLNTVAVVNKFISVHGNRYNYSEVNYESIGKKVKIGCKIHGFFWQEPTSHCNGHGCQSCSGTKKLDRPTMIDKFEATHGIRYDYSEVVCEGAMVKVKIRCNKHGYFWQSPSSHSRGAGCPACKESRGETVIRNYLTDRVDFEAEKMFKKYKEVSRLKFDFWIPSLNTCIEYQGRQHYKAIGFFGGEKSLISLKERDRKKAAFCIKNNIKLIIIPYWDFDNIESILKRELKSSKKPMVQLQIF
jgi:hypothetical protein